MHKLIHPYMNLVLLRRVDKLARPPNVRTYVTNRILKETNYEPKW